MKTAILLIWFINSVTSQIVPADKCETLAKQARSVKSWTVGSPNAACLYNDATDQEAK